MTELGPVDLVVLSFPSGQPPDSFLRALEDVEKREAVRVLDALVVAKDADGKLSRLELSDFEDLADAAARVAARRTMSLAGVEDIDEIAVVMEPDTTVLALLVENVWARETAAEVRRHDGRLLATVRIPYDRIVEVETVLGQQPAGPTDAAR
ncbi:hypothetical protein F7Q99_25490 [Streptomyces kaniharaensis]|uniref:DUF1269 domain-containing protein n=1 Tax=Streptomyces kaniharaensis TaxID=212423 RepID=A0A6N7KV73_9ACTN|nr:DUF6325 family protein [Streptomyces kaniharaensis]MQS15532.1 hypothetical protein [Streptomyces kaniharaensis]